MCKYCEEVEGRGTSGYREYISRGGAKIIFDPEDIGFLLHTTNGLTYSIEYCPWCGRKLEATEESEFSAEKEIARLEDKINSMGLILAKVIHSINRVLECPSGKRRAEAKKELEDLWGKILRERCK